MDRHVRRLVVTTDDCPVSFFRGVRQARSCPSITSKSARRFNRWDGVEIEFDDGSQRLAGWRVAQSVRHRVPPCGAFRLHGVRFRSAGEKNRWSRSRARIQRCTTWTPTSTLALSRGL